MGVIILSIENQNKKFPHRCCFYFWTVVHLYSKPQTNLRTTNAKIVKQHVHSTEIWHNQHIFYVSFYVWYPSKLILIKPTLEILLVHVLSPNTHTWRCVTLILHKNLRIFVSWGFAHYEVCFHSDIE